MDRPSAAVLLGLAAGMASAAEYPQTRLDNGQIKVTVNLPDAAKGFYKGTRFDWSGVIEDLEYRGHRY